MTSSKTFFPREIPMRLLCLSPSKTGTSSLQVALQSLEYTTFHGWDLFESKDNCKKWYDLVVAKYGPGNGVDSEAYRKVDWRKSFDDVLGSYAAVTDMPTYFFWRELLDAYPEAKVVLVERDVDGWYQSFSKSIVDHTFAPVATMITEYLEPVMGTHIGRMNLMATRAYWEGETREQIKANAKVIYKRHFVQIRDAVPEDRLLNFEMRDGWAPLCEFLGKDQPKEPFPWINEQEEYARRVWEFQKQFLWSFGNWSISKAAPVVSVAAALWIYQRK